MNPCNAATRILVGLAPAYSDLDLDLDLAETMTIEARKHPDIHVDVFDGSGLDATCKTTFQGLGAYTTHQSSACGKTASSFNGLTGFKVGISF